MLSGAFDHVDRDIHGGFPRNRSLEEHLGECAECDHLQVVKMLQTPTILIKLAQVLNLPAEKIAELFKEIFWQEISPGEMNRLLHLLLEKVEVHEGKLTVEFKSSGIKTLMEEIANGEETD